MILFKYSPETRLIIPLGATSIRIIRFTYISGYLRLLVHRRMVLRRILALFPALIQVLCPGFQGAKDRRVRRCCGKMGILAGIPTLSVSRCAQ